jgi:hypothetical protein
VAAVPFRHQHLEQLAPARHQGAEVPGGLVGRGRTGGRTASAKRAIAAASSRSVFASRPVARAKARTWRGLTTATGRPAAARAAARRTSTPPVASSTTSAGASATRALDQRRHALLVVVDREALAGRAGVDVEAVLGDVDADEDGSGGLVHDRFRWMRAVEPW